MARSAPWPATAGALATLLFLPGLAVAQSPIGTLTLEAAKERALAHNPSLRTATTQVKEREAQLSEARAAWFPRVTLAQSWQRGNQPVFVFGSLLAARRFTEANFAIDALNRPDAVGVHRSSVLVQQSVLDLARHAEGDRATRVKEAALASQEELRASVLVAVTEAYGRVVAAESGRRAAAGALEAARSDRSRAADRRDAGLASDADVLALEAHVAALVQRAARADAAATIARARLSRMIGAPLGEPYEVVDWIETREPETLGSAEVDLGALLAEAERARPALRQATAMERAADASRRAARAAYLPRLGVQAGLESSGLSFDQRESSWIVGAELAWSLSLGGAERARARAATLAAERARIEADDARTAVELDVITALAELRSARARVEAGRAAEAQARESERITRDRFEAGLASLTDLLRAQSARLDAETEHTAALVDARLSAALLNRSLGRPF